MTTNAAHEFIDPEGKVKIKMILVKHLRPIYEEEKEKYDKDPQKYRAIKEKNGSFVAYLAEQCGCDIRTIERMLSYKSQKLPTIYNLWMLYDTLKVPAEKQQEIQKEVTSFIQFYIKSENDHASRRGTKFI